MSDSTETAGLAEARAMLAQRDSEAVEYGWVEGVDVPVEHLRAAFAEVDRLTADLADMRRGIASLCADIDRAARGDHEGRVPDAPRTDVLGALASVKALRAEVVRLTTARLEGVKAGLAAAGRVCRLAELAQRRNGAVDTYAVGSRECALIIDEIDPADVEGADQ